MDSNSDYTLKMQEEFKGVLKICDYPIDAENEKEAIEKAGKIIRETAQDSEFNVTGHLICNRRKEIFHWFR